MKKSVFKNNSVLTLTYILDKTTKIMQEKIPFMDTGLC